MSAYTEILLIAYMVSLACVIPGVFLVLRKMAMLSDAITHTVLLGIVIGFFITYDLSSPILVIGAASIGILTALLVELLHKTNKVEADASIGIVFPFLFSIAIILISRYAQNTHLCVDGVLVGEIAFTPFNRLIIFGNDIGPKTLWIMGSILLVNLIIISIFFKEFKIISFDEALAAHLGFMPVLIHYLIMAMVSVTTVGAFQAVGSILVISFLIGPPITAYLLSHDLKKMIILSAVFGVINSTIGFLIAIKFDLNIAGTIASVIFINFFIVFLLAPGKGVIALIFRRKRQRHIFNMVSLIYHIANHKFDDDEDEEIGENTMHKHLGWTKEKALKLTSFAKNNGYITKEKHLFRTTNEGKNYLLRKSEKLFN